MRKHSCNNHGTWLCIRRMPTKGQQDMSGRAESDKTEHNRMLPRSHIIDEMNIASAALSDRARSISTGVLALCWVIILANRDSTSYVAIAEPQALYGPVILAIISLIMDVVQYTSGYAYYHGVYRYVVQNDMEGVHIPEHRGLHRLRQHAFVWKVATAVAAAGWLVVVLAFRLILM